jgi:hypothetical protein
MPVRSEGITLVPCLPRPLAARLHKRPGGCPGAILRELIETTPAIVPKHQLANRPGLRAYRPETIRKTVAALVKDDPVREWSRSRYGTVVVLSEVAADRNGLDFQQGIATTALPDTLDRALATARWVVKPIVEDEDDHDQTRRSGAIDSTFDRIARSRSNRYFHAREDRDRHEYGDYDRGHRVRTREESLDDQHAEPTYQRYRSRTQRSGEEPMSLKRFGLAIKERGIAKKESHGIWYLGIGLRPEVAPNSDD